MSAWYWGSRALIARLPVQRHILVDELPVLLLVTLVAGVLLYDAQLVLWEGLILLLLIAPVMLFLVVRKQKSLTPEEMAQEQALPKLSARIATFWFLVGLALLVISSRILVWGATATAEHFGISPLVIGLTVVAVGTSLPELAASIASALRGHHDIALGNVIGSNIFNLLAVMSVPTLIETLHMQASVFDRDYLATAGITALLAVVVLAAVTFKKPGTQAGIGKAVGGLLLGCYIAYYYYLFQNP